MVLMANKADEREALFNDEILPHADALANFAYNLTRSEADADDLLQETLIKAFRAIHSYQQGSNARAWLFKIMKNAFINDYRKRERRPRQVDYEEVTTFHNEEGSGPLTSYVDMRDDIFDLLLGDEATRAFQSLSEDNRTVILLCIMEDFKYEEAAEIMGIPVGTVRSKLFRAKDALKSKLVRYAEKTYGIRDVRGDKNKS